MVNYDKIFEESFWRVIGDDSKEVQFFTRFYENFMSSSEEVREKFKHTDMEHQKMMLEKSLFRVAMFNGRHVATEELQRIAEVHSRQRQNIRPGLYDLWIDALMKTVAEYEENFTDDIDLAWRVVLAPGIEFMKFHY